MFMCFTEVKNLSKAHLIKSYILKYFIKGRNKSSHSQRINKKLWFSKGN